MIQRPFLIEATRMIATRWAGRSPTGIDRVCDAYLRHFGPRAQAVVQHRGVFRILSARHSDELFAMLGNGTGTRRQIAGLALRAWAEGRSRANGSGAIYLNLSHTDFDLPSHGRWVRQCRIRPVYFIHDLIPITHAQYCEERAVMRHRGRVVNALKMAAGIVVNSRSTADDLKAFAAAQGLPLPTMAVAPLAAGELGQFAKAVPGDHPYFLCLGTIEERKNHRLLLQVWLRLIAQSGADAPRLVIIGHWGARSAAVREMLRRYPALRRYVTVITRCSDHEVRRWIGGAQALLIPTLAEGFGLPMVEALAIGTPVIASDLPCFRENGQGIPCLLDPAHPGAWTQAIHGFSEPEGERQRQLQLLERYHPPVWEDHFAVVDDWLAAAFSARSDQVAISAGAPFPVLPARAAARRRSGAAQPSLTTIEARP